MRTASEWQSYNTTRLPLSRIDPKSLYSVMRKRYSGKKSLGSFFSSEAYRSKPCIHLIVQYCLDRLRRSPQVIPTTKYMHCEKSIKEATCVSILLLCLCLLLSWRWRSFSDIGKASVLKLCRVWLMRIAPSGSMPVQIRWMISIRKKEESWSEASEAFQPIPVIVKKLIKWLRWAQMFTLWGASLV